MNNFIKKAFLISMVVILSLWGVVGAVTVPVHANVASTGDLIKTATNPAVYYLSADGKRYTFNHAREYFTWYDDFSGVVTIADTEMFSYDLGGTVVLRPGARLMQYVSVQGDGTWMIASPNVYAVSSNGTIMALDSAETAVALYGENWEQMIVAIPDYLSGYYTTGAALTSTSTYPTGTLVKMAGSDQVYYIEGTTKRPVTADGMTGNNLNMDYVLTASDLSGYTDGTSVTGVEGDIANPVGGATATPIGTGLTVALSPSSPGAQVAPGLATNVPLLKVNLTASTDGAVTVNSLVFTKSGPSDNNDMSYYYLYDGATRLTSGKSLNNTSLTVTFSNLNLSVAAGTTKALTFSADVAALVSSGSGATAGGVHIYSLASADGVSTSAQVNGSFPLSGNTVTIGSVSTGWLDVDANGGTLTNPTVGQTGATVAQFKVTNSSAEIMHLSRLSLYQTGTLENAKFSNLKLYQSSTLLAEVSGINGDSLAVFDLATPFVLDKSQNRIFTVTADIAGSARNGDTTKFYLDSESDVYALGQTYGYGACVDAGTTTCTSSAVAGTYDGTSTNYSETTVQGGQVTVANNGPSADNVSVGQTNVPMLKFAITAGVNIEVKQWRVELIGLPVAHADCVADYISNLRIVDDNGGSGTSAVNCSDLTAVTDGGYYQFTDIINIDAGETRNYTVYMDISSSMSASTTYVVLGNTASANTFSATAVKNTDNNQYVTDIVPSTQTRGTNQVIGTASLTTALGNYKGEVTAVKGSANVKFLEYNLTTGVSSPATINSIKFASYVDYDGSTGSNTFKRNYGSGTSYIDAKDVVTQLKLYSGNQQLGTVESIDTSGYVTFDNLGWTIPADSTVDLVLKGDLSNNAYFNDNADRVAFDILTTDASYTFIDAVDQDGNSISTITAQRNGTLTNAPTAGTASVTETADITMDSNYSYVTVQNTGTLNAYSYSTPANALVVSGTDGVTVLRVRFHATRENLTVNKLSIQAKHAANYRALEGVTLSYTNSAGQSVETAPQAIIGSGYAQFTGLDLYVAKDTDSILTVKANYADIGPNVAYTGDPVTLAFEDGNRASSFEVVGADAGSNTVFYSTSNSDYVAATPPNDTGYINGNLTIVKKTIPTFTKVAVTNSLANGTTELYKFTVSTAEGSITQLKSLKMYVRLNDITEAGVSSTVQDFSVSKDGQALTFNTDYTFLNGYAPATTTTDCLALDGDSTCNGTLTAGGDDGTNGTSTDQLVVLVFNSEQTIESNDPVDYAISASFSGLGSTADGQDSVIFYLAAADAASSTYGYMESSSDTYEKDYVALASTSAGTSEAQANYVWSDYSGSSGDGDHGTVELTSNDWTNGYLLMGNSLGSGYGNTLLQP